MSARACVLSTIAAAVLIAGCGDGEAAQSGSPTSSTTSMSVPVRVSANASGLRLVKVADFNQPTYLTAAPREPSRVFVVQRTGQIDVLLNGRKRSRPYLDIHRLVNANGAEQGLLGLAFRANYAHTGLLYVGYTTANNDVRVAQYRRSTGNPNAADPTSARTILTIDHRAFTNHNGGQLAFGPDGYLYVGVGDGGSEDDPHDYGQNTATLLGKLLRIDPSPTGGYTIPPTNPFVRMRARRAEIWAYGLRNPWRFSFDRLTGDMIIGDVGQDLEEEVDFVPSGSGRGANYGWSLWEGDRRNKPGHAVNAVFPNLVALHRDGYCALIGGYVVRDRSLPSLYGRYLFGDNCRPPIESAKLGAHRVIGLRATGLRVSATSSFGEDARGHIYIVSLDGPVYRIAQR